MIKELNDFSAGICSDLPIPKRPKNSVQAATNLIWDRWLKKRRGFNSFHVRPADGKKIIGHFWAVVNGKGVTFYVLWEAPDTITFESNYSGAFAEIDATVNWTGTDGEIDAELAVINEQVVVVDQTGANLAYVIYEDSGLKMATLDEYDLRTIGESFWFAGIEQSGNFIDYTSQAQDAATGDIPVDISTDGVFVSSNGKFSRFILKGFPALTGATVVLKYWDGSAWVNGVMEAVTWTAGDKTINFTIPDDWAQFQGDEAEFPSGETAQGTLNGNFAVYLDFTAGTGSGAFDGVEVFQAKQAFVAFAGKNPSHVVVHQSRMYLGVENVVYYGLYGEAKGWEAYYAEFFADGGPEIVALRSMEKMLCVVKEDAISGLYGTDPETFTIKRLSNHGTVNRASCAVVRGILFYETDADIMVFAGEEPMKISGHIDSIVTAGGVGASFDETYWYLVSNGDILTVRADSLSSADSGEMFAAFWYHQAKYTGASEFPVVYGDSNEFGDNNIKNRLVIAAEDRLVCLSYGDTTGDNDPNPGVPTMPWSFTTQPIIGSKTTAIRQNLTRLKVLATGPDLTLRMLMDLSTGLFTYSETFTPDNNYGIQEFSIPYQMDGDRPYFGLSGDDDDEPEILGFALEYKSRRF